MSDNLARVLRPNWDNTPDPVQAPDTRHIEIVSTRSQRRARPRIVYALSAVAGMATIVIVQLLLSVGISQGAYEVSRLQASQVALGRTAESVTEDLVRISSPQSLAANAEAVRRRDQSAPGVLLESSGGITLERAAALAATGVDRISVGALTHSAPALDIGLDFETVLDA